eukprot:scaffold6862_cov92-Skeletonema_dohrnii-CCMP3373.AAC.1
MGISTLFGVETNNRQLYQTTSLAVVRDKSSWSSLLLLSYTIDIYYDYPLPTSGIFQATSSLRGYMHALYFGYADEDMTTLASSILTS